MPSPDYLEKFPEAAYNTVNDSFAYDGYLSEENVPLEFSAIIKEGVDRFFADNPDADRADFALIDFPSSSSLPSFMDGLIAFPSSSGGYDVYSPIVPDVHIYIPDSFERVGDILESVPNLSNERPTLPVGYIGDGRLDNALEATKDVFNNVTPAGELTVMQEYMRNRAAGNETFERDGVTYSTKVDPFDIDETTGLPADMDIPSPDAYDADRTRGFDYTYEMRIPDRVRNDPYGADFTTGATVIGDE